METKESGEFESGLALRCHESGGGAFKIKNSAESFVRQQHFRKSRQICGSAWGRQAADLSLYAAALQPFATIDGKTPVLTASTSI